MRVRSLLQIPTYLFGRRRDDVRRVRLLLLLHHAAGLLHVDRHDRRTGRGLDAHRAALAHAHRLVLQRGRHLRQYGRLRVARLHLDAGQRVGQRRRALRPQRRAQTLRRSGHHLKPSR